MEVAMTHTTSAEAPAVQQIPVPTDVRELSTLARIDYADTFLVHTDHPGDRTAEQWARTMIEDAPAGVRTALLSGWTAIGLQLSPWRSDRHVLGWPVRHAAPEYVLLGAESRIGLRGELLFDCRQAQRLMFATFVQQDNQLARAVWARVEPVHVPIVRRVLEQGCRRSAS
jgi:hypothetical protein